MIWGFVCDLRSLKHSKARIGGGSTAPSHGVSYDINSLSTLGRKWWCNRTWVLTSCLQTSFLCLLKLWNKEVMPITSFQIKKLIILVLINTTEFIKMRFFLGIRLILNKNAKLFAICFALRCYTFLTASSMQKKR